MAKKKKQQNIPAIIITAVAVLFAVAAVVFLVITMSKNNEDEDDQPEIPESTGFVADADLLEEIEQAAYELLTNNQKAYQYFTKGMSYKEEPYGNLPEDGFYTCVSENFSTFDDFCEFVRSIYTEETAEKLLTDPFGNGPVYGDDNGELGLSAEFVPSDEDGLSWANVSFVCVPVSETVCDITVTFKDENGKEAASKEVRMLMENTVWKLADMIG